MIIDDALRYMGVLQPTADDKENVKKAVKEIEAALQKNCVLKEVAVSDIDEVLIGNDILKHIEGCDRVILFLATLGMGVDRLIKKAQIESMARAVYIDAAASALLEDYCDSLCAEIAKSKIITDRFSPGYGDLPIEVQPKLLKAIGAEKIGVSCSKTFMMIPTKSVSALIGIRGEKA